MRVFLHVMYSMCDLRRSCTVCVRHVCVAWILLVCASCPRCANVICVGVVCVVLLRESYFFVSCGVKVICLFCISDVCASRTFTHLITLTHVIQS